MSGYSRTCSYTHQHLHHSSKEKVGLNECAQKSIFISGHHWKNVVFLSGSLSLTHTHTSFLWLYQNAFVCSFLIFHVCVVNQSLVFPPCIMEPIEKEHSSCGSGTQLPTLSKERLKASCGGGKRIRICIQCKANQYSV